MSDVELILGPVVFRDFEIGAGVGFGGRQRLVVHQLPGGARVIDALGRDDREITLSGIFSGSDATLRARLLDEMRSIGAPVPLTWDVFFYRVVIHEYIADYQNRFWIPYRLSCTVLRDEASELVESALSLADSVLADVTSAVSQTLSGIDLVQTQLDVSTPNSTTRGTAAFSRASSSLNASRRAIEVGLAGTGETLASAGFTLGGTADAPAGSSALLGATEAAGRLSALATARAYVGRASTNLENAST